MNQTRLNRVVANMAAQGLEQIVVTATASVYYLTGIHVEPMERMRSANSAVQAADEAAK